MLGPERSSCPRHFCLGTDEQAAFRMMDWHVCDCGNSMPTYLLREKINPRAVKVPVNLVRIDFGSDFRDYINLSPLFERNRAKDDGFMTLGVKLDQIAI